ncbi:MAG TPA: hypothetical protein VFE30_09515 [Anaeromyxobacteraceae bacterium]|jgi:hypothetical protein|nr:hypothetical protein [Anaeromyxobacteraceae bacterium]
MVKLTGQRPKFRARTSATPAIRAQALENRHSRLDALRKRDRLEPALRRYDALLRRLQVAGHRWPEREALGHITSMFLRSYADVQEQISASGKRGIRAINAIKRSAGTNYQGLVEYGVLRWLETTDLALNVGPNAPKSMKDELTIYGTDSSGPFQVEPDIDISLWEEGGSARSPLLLVSAKTSLVDRAGQAARWKLYLDMHQTKCPHTSKVPDCPIHRTRIKVRTQHPITHAICTANIYKMDTTLPQGELESGQCRNNTYMFAYRYTTRTEDIKPVGWRSFREFAELVQQIFGRARHVRTATPLPSRGSSAVVARRSR